MPFIYQTQQVAYYSNYITTFKLLSYGSAIVSSPSPPFNPDSQICLPLLSLLSLSMLVNTVLLINTTAKLGISVEAVCACNPWRVTRTECTVHRVSQLAQVVLPSRENLVNCLPSSSYRAVHQPDINIQTIHKKILNAVSPKITLLYNFTF